MKTFAQAAAATVIVASTVSAQYAIVPSSVNNSTRQAWCFDQQTQCPLICLQTPASSAETLSNTCDWVSLTYSCVCSNGQSPNVSEYSQTLPYFICTEWGNQCVSNCNGNDACASDCRQNHPCGALNPSKHNASSVTTSMSTTTTGADAGATVDSSGQTIYTGFAGAGAASTGGSGGGGSGGSGSGAASNMVRVWALSAGQTFGSIMVFGSMTLGFAILL